MGKAVKPMIYRNPFVDGFSEMGILAQGSYKGHRYVVADLVTHPCGYIENNLSDGRLAKVNSVVHGGITYVGKSKWDDTDCNYIGWDYMHSGDYNPILGKGIKYTTEDVLEECFKAIDCLVEVESDE